MDNNHRILILILYSLFYGCVVVGTDSYNCTFDDGFCDWKQVNNNNFQLMWRRQDTTSSSTGPDSDHTSGVGSYIYISSSNGDAKKKARLLSPLKSPGKYCLSFWYYMNGRATDILLVTVKENNTKLRLFKISDDPKKMWIFFAIVFTTTENFKIFIDAIIEEDEHDNGYVAVDDVMIFSEQCPQYCTDPTLVFGNEFFGDIWVGSVIHIDVTCIEGYERKGNSSIVCQNNGKWTELPKCQPIDCGKPLLGKGMVDVIPEETYYNTTIKLSCSKGFTLIGSNSITCMANGNWSILPKCVFNNCSNPTPTSGNVSSANFQVGSRIEVTCATGYRLIGNKVILCHENSTWSDNPDCERIECPKPILTKGFLERNGTTWYSNQFLLLACSDDYTLIGNATIACQDDGNWTKLPTCNDNEESDTGALTAVAVTVPLLVIVILGIAFVFVCRKRERLCMKDKKTRGHGLNAQIQYPNNTYNIRGHDTDNSKEDKPSGQDTEYAVISKRNTPELKDKDTVFYNNIKHGAGVRNNKDYDHMKISFEPGLDNTYNHIQDMNKETKEKQGKNSTDSYSYTNAAFQEIDDEYNHTDLKRPSTKQNNVMHWNKDQEPVYDHAKAGGCDPVTLELDEYSHLNTVANGQDQQAKRSICILGITEDKDQERNYAYGKTFDDTAQYYNVERQENSFTPEKERHYFVLEEEDKDEEYFNTERHDYFILEKNE